MQKVLVVEHIFSTPLPLQYPIQQLSTKIILSQPQLMLLISQKFIEKMTANLLNLMIIKMEKVQFGQEMKLILIQKLNVKKMLR